MNTIESNIPKGTLPLVAILRGVSFEDIGKVTSTLIDAGIEVIEITLNTPDAFKSLEYLVTHHGANSVIGAGTVLNVENVQRVHDLGGKFIVSPNVDPAVIEKTKALGMTSIPGAFSPTEIFKALDLGADIIKIFPCILVKPQGIRAIRATLPEGTKLIPTGGVNIPQGLTYAPDGTLLPQADEKEDILAYLQAGSWGIGLGSNLYNSKMSLPEATRQAKLAVKAMQEQLKSFKTR